MSANYLVDLGGTCQLTPTWPYSTSGLFNGQFIGTSGTYIGQSVYLGNSDSYCNIVVTLTNVTQSSGAVVVQVQTANTDTSGSYGDPTSGLASLPGAFQSGGLLWIGSGSTGGLLNSGFTSGSAILSGATVAAAFQRPQNGLFARANLVSPSNAASGFVGTVSVSFVTQSRTTGSGGGFTNSPLATSTINV